MKDIDAGRKSNYRSVWLDAAKGIGIILVMLSHSEFWSFCQSNSQVVFISWSERVIRIALASYMPLFYVLSGYTFKDRPDLLKLRFKRLLKPYILWGGAAMIITWIMLYIKSAAFMDFLKPTVGLIYSRYSLFPHVRDNNIYFFTGVSTPLWFLTSLFTSYILFQVIIKFQKYRAMFIGGYIAATILLTRLPILLPWSLDVAPAGALFIYVGYAMKNHEFISYSSHKFLIFTVPLLMLYYVLVRYNGEVNMSVREYGQSPLLFLLIGTIGSIFYCIFALIIEKYKICDLLAYIGRLSLTILCSHKFAFAFVCVIFSESSPLHTDYFAPAHYCFILEIAFALMFAICLVEMKNFAIIKMNHIVK